MRRLTHEEISRKRHSEEELRLLRRIPLIVLLDNVRSLYNVGSIFRTSDGARIEKLILTGYTPSPPRKGIDKTALGATRTVPWEHIRDPLAAVRTLRESGLRVGILEQTTASVPYYALRASDFPMCLVVGNEITGVSKVISTSADLAIDIPMYGMKQSLNVAVAYGIVAFHFVQLLRLSDS